LGTRYRALVDRLRGSLIQCWVEMLAKFPVEASEAFDGENPAQPQIRAIMDWMRS
jgi:hypothetical protein